MMYSFQAKIGARGFHVYKNLAWSNAKQGYFGAVEIETDKELKKIDPYCCAIKAMVDIPPRLKTVGHVPREISRDIFYFLKEKNGKVDGFVYSMQSQPSPIPAGGLEIPLKVTFKIANFITHQKMKDYMANLYSYDYEAKAEADEDNDAEIHFMIANEHLDGDKEDDREVVKRKVKRKPPKIGESSESDCQGSEMVEATVKRKPPKVLDTMSNEDWDLRLRLFCQSTNFKKIT